MNKKSIFLLGFLFLLPSFLYGWEGVDTLTEKNPLMVADRRGDSEPEEDSGKAPAWLKRSGPSWQQPDDPPEGVNERAKQDVAAPGAETETRPEWLKRSGSSWQKTGVPSKDIGDETKQHGAEPGDGSASGAVSLNQPKLFIFRPLDPLKPPAGESAEVFRFKRETQWVDALGALPKDKHGDLVKDLVDYETNPNIVTALKALKHFNTLSHNKHLRDRAHDFNLKLFLTLDALKFELPLQAVLRENKRRQNAGKPLIEFSYRVGSSGKRFRQWVDWAAKGKDLAGMPIDDIYRLKKLDKADDDNTNEVSDKALKKDPLLNEQVNGTRMEDVVAQVTSEWTGGKVVVKASEDLQMEFLSPTKAYPILYVEHHKISVSDGLDGKWDQAWNEKWPNFQAADVVRNKEKYRGAYAEEQLHTWGLKAGYVVDLRKLGTEPNIQQIAAATTEYAKSGIADIKGRTPFSKGTVDPSGWMANQYRMAFLVHKGSVQDVAKYTQRMVLWWDTFNIKTAQDLRNRGVEISDPDFNFLNDLARKIRSPKNEAELMSAIGNKTLQDEALKKLKHFNKLLLVGGHRRHVADLTDNLISALRQYGEPGKGPIKEGRAPPTIDDLMAANNKDNPFYKTMETLATAYSNLPQELIDELNKDHARKIKEKEKSNTSEAIYRVEVHKILLAAMKRAQKAGTRLGDHGQALTEIHGLVKELRGDINAHLKQIAEGADLDGYIDRVIAGEMRRKRVRVIWKGEGSLPEVTWVVTKEQWTPADVRDDLKVLHTLAELCGWSNKTYAMRLYEYFEGPSNEIRKKNILTRMRHKSWASLGVEGLRSLKNLYDPKNMKERFVELPTVDGKTMRLHHKPTGGRLEAGLNLGVTAFKLTIKGAQGTAYLWKVSGDVTDVKELALNIYKTAVPASGETMETRAQRYAMILSKTISLFEYAENVATWAKNPYLVDKLGSTLATAAELSADPYDDDAVKKLASAMLKDIALWVQPELALAFAAYEIYNYGSTKLSLHHAKENFVNLLVENGDWEWKDKKGNDLPRPRLKGVFITKKPEGSSPGILNDPKARKECCIRRAVSADATGRFQGKSSCNDGLIRLTKVPEPAWINGIILFKSGGTVHPRKDLLTIFYKEGYQSKDPILKHVIKAAKGIPSKPLWRSPEKWTAMWLHTDLKITVPTKEDATRIANRKIIVKVEKNKLEPIQADPGDLIPMLVDTNILKGVKEGARKNFGYLVSEYWTRRQNIMECAMLDPLVEMATRRKEEESIDKLDFDKFLAEMRRLDKRMQELDRKVWAEIARSADPFEGPEYDPNDKKERYIPITKDYRKRTAPLEKTIEQMTKKLKEMNTNRPSEGTGKRDNKGMPEGVISMMKSEARSALQKMLKVVEGYEDTYNGVLTLLAGTEKWVGENSGLRADSAGMAAPGLALKPYHAALRPGRTYGSGSAHDVLEFALPEHYDSTEFYLSPKPGLESEELAKKWDEEYRKEFDTVRDDLGAIIKKMLERLRPLVDAGDLLPIACRTLWSRWAEFMQAEHQELATYHPYWNRMLRLRFQIRKIENMLPGADEATREEVEAAFKPMVLEKKKGVEILEGWDGTNAASHLQNAKSRMMTRYKQLKKLAERMFDMELKIKPDDELKVTDKMIVTLETKPRKDLKGPDEKEIQQMVHRYLFELAPQEENRSCPDRNDGRFWPADYVPAPKPKAAKKSASKKGDASPQGKQDVSGEQAKAADAGADPTPSVKKAVEWKKRLRKAGKYKLRVIALTRNDVPLSSKTLEDVEIKPARMLGKLEIVGEWDSKEDKVAVFMGVADVEKETPRFRLTQAGDFDMPLCSFSAEEIPPDVIEPKGDKAKPSKFPPKRFEAYAGVEQPEKLSPDVADIKEPGVILKPKSKCLPVRFEERAKFKVEKPLRLEFSQGVVITVEVFDASGKHAIKNAAVTIHGGGATHSGYTAVMMLKPEDVVYAGVGYSGSGFSLNRNSRRISYDPEAHAKGITLKVNMPFFPKGALMVKGCFVPEGGKTYSNIIDGGDLWSNIAEKQTVEKGGDFKFKNDRPVLVEKGLEIRALVFRRKDKRLMAPADGKTFKKKIVPKAINDLGDIKVKPYDVEVDGVRVAVQDWTGKTMPDKGTTVKAGYRKASRVNEEYKCAVTFKYKGGIDIEARFDMPTGEPITGTTSISLDRFADPFKPKPPQDPLEIDLGVYLPGSLKIKGRTEFEVRKGMKPPDKVDLWLALGHPDLFEEWSESVGAEFFDELTEPVRRNVALDLEATAASEDATFSAKASKRTPKARSKEKVAIVDFGVIKLKGKVKLVEVPNVTGKPLKEATDVLTGHGFRVAPQDGDPAPERKKEKEVYRQEPIHKKGKVLKLGRGAEIKLWAYGAVEEDPTKPYRPRAYIESVEVDKPVAWRGDTVKITARIFAEDMRKGNPIWPSFIIRDVPESPLEENSQATFFEGIPSKNIDGDYINQVIETVAEWNIKRSMLITGDFYPVVELKIPMTEEELENQFYISGEEHHNREIARHVAWKAGKITVKGKTNRLSYCEINGPVVGPSECPFRVWIRYSAFDSKGNAPRGLFQIRFDSVHIDSENTWQKGCFKVTTSAGSLEDTPDANLWCWTGSQPARSPLEGALSFRDLKLSFASFNSVGGGGFITGADCRLNGAPAEIKDAVMTVSGQLDPGGPMPWNKAPKASGTFRVDAKYIMDDWDYKQKKHPKPISFSGTWSAGRIPAASDGHKVDTKGRIYPGGKHKMITGEEYDDLCRGGGNDAIANKWYYSPPSWSRQ